MMATEQQIEVMARHYILAAIWADAPEGTRPRAPGWVIERVKSRCIRFVELIGPLFDEAMACEGYGAHPDCGNIEPRCAAMGHDLYLTSAGHGVGFWDRDELGELGAKLSEFCGFRKPFDDPQAQFWRGWLYFTGL